MLCLRLRRSQTSRCINRPGKVCHQPESVERVQRLRCCISRRAAGAKSKLSKKKIPTLNTNPSNNRFSPFLLARHIQMRFDFNSPRQWLSVYEEVAVDTEAAVSSVKLQRNETRRSDSNFFAMSSNLLLRVPVQDCGKYSTCKGCARSGDPFCVWYTLEGRFVRSFVCACLYVRICSCLCFFGSLLRPWPYLSSSAKTTPSPVMLTCSDLLLFRSRFCVGILRFEEHVGEAAAFE